MGSIKTAAERLRRYTTLASAIHILSTSKVTLLNPESWDDKNDTRFMDAYRKKSKANAVQALCFAQASETYHHWRVFAPGGEGVCIEFDKGRLLEDISKDPSVRYGQVIYRKVRDFDNGENITIPELPFTKRWPYRDEKEFRFVRLSDIGDELYYNVEINLGCVRRLVLSPWMPKPLSFSVKSFIQNYIGGSGISIYRSHLVGYEKWAKIAERA